MPEITELNKMKYKSEKKSLVYFNPFFSLFSVFEENESIKIKNVKDGKFLLREKRRKENNKYIRFYVITAN